MYVKGYGLLFFAKYMSEIPSSIFGWKILDNTKKLAIEALKTDSKKHSNKQQKQLVI